MDEEDVHSGLLAALATLVEHDSDLMEYDVSERCIAGRLAMYLQREFEGFSVDVEYNRDGLDVKRLGLPDRCANKRNEHGQSIVVPDIVVHRRGESAYNLLVVELKKATSRVGTECDVLRVNAFIRELDYRFGAVLLCGMSEGEEHGGMVKQWCRNQKEGLLSS